MKILLAPDKFKGSVSALEACNAMAEGVIKSDPDIEIIKLPMADGGEGTLKVLESVLNLKKEYVSVNDPLFRPIEAYYLKNGNVAFIEMAKASGLQLLKASEHSPMNTSTYGTGEFIKHAIESGATQINLLIGGSATNDAGIGMASALGYIFKDDGGEIRTPNGKAPQSVLKIDSGRTNELLQGIQFNVLCDVDNPLYGPNGAAYVYAKQKGANDQEVQQLDQGLQHLASILDNGFEHLPGSGAAGGLGYGAMSFLNAELKSGIEFMLEVTDFYNQLNEVDLVVTGEGKVDAQSLQGKVVSGVQKAANEANVPMVIIAGQLEGAAQVIKSLKPRRLISLVNDGVTEAMAMKDTKRLLKEATFEMIRSL